jgi:hypothetical protein
MKTIQDKKYIVPAIAAGVGIGGLLYYLLKDKKPVVQKRNLNRLNKAEARRRKQLIGESNVEYFLELFFPKNREEYMGRIIIKFEISLLEDISLDFQKSSVIALTINETDIESPKDLISADQILLVKEFLVVGLNTVVVEFSNLYDKDDVGLLKYKNGDECNIHTSVCGYLPSLIFPCFDQPDIKCLLKLKVIVPKEYKTVGNEKVSSELDPENSVYLSNDNYRQYKEVEFMKSKKIPIHDFGLMIGTFEQKKFSKSFKTIPLSIYYRKSMESSVSQHFENLVTVTFATLEFFFSKFGSKYPFSKLDLVFTETPIPAIEYPGCILINETYLRCEQGDQMAHMDQYLIVIHEIIHMWFGNLVTCDWWDNIFIHEAFANFLSVLILQETLTKLKNTEFDPDLYLLVNKAEKSFIYSSLPHSRSVKFEMNDIELTNLIFDPITYNKGEAILYYFYSNIGSQKFLEVAKKLITTKAWGNISYDEFLDFFDIQDKNKLDNLLRSKQPEIYHLEFIDEKKHLSIKRSTNFSAIEFENIDMKIYDFSSNSTKMQRFNIRENNIHVPLSDFHDHSGYIFNTNTKGYFLYQDSKENFASILKNANQLSTSDLYAYFINLYNYVVVTGSQIEDLTRLFIAGYEKLIKFAPKPIVKMVTRVVFNLSKESEKQFAMPLMFNVFFENERLSAAARFITTETEINLYKNKLDASEDVLNKKEWKAFILRLQQIGRNDLLEIHIPKYKSLFQDNEYFSIRELFSSKEDLKANWIKIVLYRSGFNNLEYYKSILHYVKRAIPMTQRVELARVFILDLEKVTQFVPKFYIKHLINGIIPAERFDQFEETKNEILVAIGKMSNMPYVEQVLITRFELMCLFNK